MIVNAYMRPTGAPCDGAYVQNQGVCLALPVYKCQFQHMEG